MVIQLISRKWLPGLSLLGLLVIVGCGSSQPDVVVGTISGTVKLKGTPMKQGVIRFVNSGSGSEANAELSESGQYRIEVPIATGEYQVSFGPPLLPPPDQMASAKPVLVNIPGKYQDPTTSGFSATIKEGENQHDFELK
ncbi:hypothetical protein [Planctomicrobium sp. SH527]|uniref:hypothetical protein n=1 Tax=Planctomicrobium sp. SH527 TaxID=3448123 RepID=UPI003F5BB10A